MLVLFTDECELGFKIYLNELIKLCSNNMILSIFIFAELGFKISNLIKSSSEKLPYSKHLYLCILAFAALKAIVMRLNNTLKKQDKMGVKACFTRYVCAFFHFLSYFCNYVKIVWNIVHVSNDNTNLFNHDLSFKIWVDEHDFRSLNFTNSNIINVYEKYEILSANKMLAFHSYLPYIC